MALPPLYKYLDVQGAKLTLGNRTFKHAKPTDFNDTEDLTIQSIFPEDVEKALERLTNSFTDVMVKNLNKQPTCSEPMRAKVALLQQVYRENPRAAEFVKEQIRNNPDNKVFDVEHMRARSQAFVQEINEHLRANRVLCVTTQNNSERMWKEYAQNNEGIALRIEPNVEKDSKFQLFRRVDYYETRPSLYADTLDFIEGSLFGDQEGRLKTMVDRVIYTKTLKWKHENEYRLAIPIRPGENWDTLPYHPEEVTELYLGRAMTNQNKEEIVDTAKAVNPVIKVFQVDSGKDGRLSCQKLR